MSDRKALLKPSGVAPGTYGSGSLVPVIVVDVEGRIIGITTAAVSGGGGGAWSALTDPAGNLSLAMAANLTTLTWAGNFSTNSAFKLAGNNTSATGPLLHLTTAVSNLIPPLLVEPRTGQSLKCDHLQNVEIGKSQPLNSDTDGFPYFPVLQSNAEPSATPTSKTGFAPFVLESDGIQGEYRAWAYLGGAWRCLTPSGRLWEATSGSGAKTIDWTCKGEVATRQHTAGSGNNTFTFTAPAQGTTCILIYIQDATGGRTVTWPASVKWPAGSPFPPDTSSNAKTIYHFVYDGSNYLNVGAAGPLS